MWTGVFESLVLLDHEENKLELSASGANHAAAPPWPQDPDLITQIHACDGIAIFSCFHIDGESRPSEGRPPDQELEQKSGAEGGERGKLENDFKVYNFKAF
ncbi:hypothetical protein ACJRO7_006381 [Eucalyptus globulus]|uniref:Uncharacterized protein n=1 Tax=Eucalyptus globulus TaxID=34317 RepID=A0ABD3IJ59_EUCGL